MSFSICRSLNSMCLRDGWIPWYPNSGEWSSSVCSCRNKSWKTRRNVACARFFPRSFPSNTCHSSQHEPQQDNDVEVVLLPCGHHCLCRGCAANLVICPLCRASIENRVRTFGSWFTAKIKFWWWTTSYVKFEIFFRFGLVVSAQHCETELIQKRKDVGECWKNNTKSKWKRSH